MFETTLCDSCGSGRGGLGPFMEIKMSRKVKQCNHCKNSTQNSDENYYVCDLECFKHLLLAGFPCKPCCATGIDYGNTCIHCEGSRFYGKPGSVDDIYFVKRHRRFQKAMKAASRIMPRN